MKILGIRNAPQQIRYAIVESHGGVCSLLNGEGETLIKKPIHIEDVGRHLLWVKDELERVIRQNPDLDVIALKTPEFQGSKTSASRHGDYLDAVVLLVASQAGIPVVSKLYSQMSTRRADVLRNAEERVARTAKHWNEQMADAIAVAWSARR